jgi:hypothetical protein
LVLGYSDVKDIWDKLVWVNEEIIFQWLNLFMKEFKLQRDPEIDITDKLLSLRSYSRTWIQSCVLEGCSTHQLNWYMGKS